MVLTKASAVRVVVFFFSSRRRHTRSYGDWSSDVCSSDLSELVGVREQLVPRVVPDRGPHLPVARAALAPLRARTDEMAVSGDAAAVAGAEVADRKSVVEGQSGGGGGRATRVAEVIVGSSA